MKGVHREASLERHPGTKDILWCFRTTTENNHIRQPLCLSLILAITTTTPRPDGEGVGRQSSRSVIPTSNPAQPFECCKTAPPPVPYRKTSHKPHHQPTYPSHDSFHLPPSRHLLVSQKPALPETFARFHRRKWTDPRGPPSWNEPVSQTPRPPVCLLRV